MFAFAPKLPGTIGHRILNEQLLAFAAYQQEDGTILGDPRNLKFTNDAISLGWCPPAIRTRWDLLPLVTMASGDKPFITHIPDDLFPIIPIEHPEPQYKIPFRRLGLRWVPAPVLSSLGFDVGGLQYTAAPFIGWFMDAEIGVRNLADSFRYNCLPSVAQALSLIKNNSDLTEISQSRKLLMITRAQSELNFAVHSSFVQRNVRIIDTLSASETYCNFDDEHYRQYGFRLPANPYYMAPPQGSIVKLWHHGGSPNYQPRPMISRQVPYHGSKQFKRSKGVRECQVTAPQSSHPQIRVVYCSAGTVAPMLAERLRGKLTKETRVMSAFSVRPECIPLNDLRIEQFKAGDVILIVASSSGRGDVPPNGKTWLTRIENGHKHLARGIRFFIFGNGNASYKQTFNGSAIKIQAALTNCGLEYAAPLFHADSLREDPPLKQCDQWLSIISQQIGVQSTQSSPSGSLNGCSEDADDCLSFLEDFSKVQLSRVSATSKVGLRIVSLNTGALRYQPMQHVEILVPLAEVQVSQLMSLLSLNESDTVDLHGHGKACSLRHLLSFVDIQKPFKSYRWATMSGIDLNAEETLRLENIPINEALASVLSENSCQFDKLQLLQLLKDMPMRKPRTFSVASAPECRDSCLDLLVQSYAGGLFTHTFLSSAKIGDRLYCRLRPGPGLALAESNRPVIAFVTGSGIAPLRALLQARVNQRLNSQQLNDSEYTNSAISVFVGCKEDDVDIVEGCIEDAVELGIIDILCVVQSNAFHWRVQDELLLRGHQEAIKAKVLHQDSRVFVCASKEAADDFAKVLGAVIGVDSVRDVFGSRWVEEVFVAAP